LLLYASCVLSLFMQEPIAVADSVVCARYEIHGHPQARTPLRSSLVLEAATRSSFLSGGIVKAEGFGDGSLVSENYPQDFSDSVEPLRLRLSPYVAALATVKQIGSR